MRPFLLAVPWALLACAPLAAHAAWPSQGLQVSTPYQYNSEGFLLADGTGDVLSLVNNTGHFPHWKMDRLTSDGAYANGWTQDGNNLGVDGTPAPDLAILLDGIGGLWNAQDQKFSPSTTQDIWVTHVNLDGTASMWNVAGTSAQEMAPAIATDGAGGVFVSWWRNFTQLWLQRVKRDGTVQTGWPAGGRLLLSTAYGQFRAHALGDGSGGVLLLVSSSDNSSNLVSLLRVDGAGGYPAGWTAPGLILRASPSTTFTLLGLLPSDATHVWATWAEAGRIVAQRVSLAGELDPAWPTPLIEIFSSALGAARTNVVVDGLGGLQFVCRTGDGGARLQHLLANGAWAPGFVADGITPLDDAAVLDTYSGIFATAGADGRVIVCWDDRRAGESGPRARWLLADGTPDPAEPAAGRVIVLDPPPDGLGYEMYVLAALADGDGGAYFQWSNSSPYFAYSTPYVKRLYRSSLLGVSPPRTPSTLALAVGPNPALGSLVIRLALAEDAPARLSLHDASGRRVRERAVAGRGEHVERFDDVEALAPGVYLLRLEQRGQARVARIALIR